jgi:hypothetical protein
MRSIIIRGVLAAVAALTVACGSTDTVAPTRAPQAAQRTIADAGNAPIRRAIDQTVWFSCGNGGAGEGIRITGELRYDVQTTMDATGVYHFSVKSNTQGATGVGLTTGTFFRGLMIEHINSKALDYLNEDVRTTDIIRFVAPGSGASFSLIATSHFIVDQGSYVLWDQTWDEACR